LKPVLIFGYGNPSRGDDALGPLLLEHLQARATPDIDYVSDFQLQPEHALDLLGRDLALFVDAHLSCPAPFSFTRLHPARDSSYSSHAMSPAAVLQVYLDIHQSPPPPAYLLSIRGERFELGENLSPAAQAHLEAACAFADSLCAAPKAENWQTCSG
jgi:hydrogenase maturation protease